MHDLSKIKEEIAFADEEVDELVRWEKDALLVGTVLSYKPKVGKHGRSMFIVVRDENEEIQQAWCSPKVLKDKLEDCGMKPGDQVAIKCHGTKTSEGGKEYKTFTVKVYPQEDEKIPF